MKTVVTCKQKSPEGVPNSTGGTRKTSSYELQALREQSAWEHGKVGYGRGTSCDGTVIYAFKILNLVRGFFFFRQFTFFFNFHITIYSEYLSKLSTTNE